MKLSALLLRLEQFVVLAKSESLPKDSDNLAIILQNLSNLETFKARVDYAEKNLSHLSSGSSRVVFSLNNNKQVLKLAKNDRGIAQNLLESSVKCKYIVKTTKSCPKGVWKISPFLQELSESEFQDLTQINFKDFGQALEYGLQSVSKDSAKKPKDFETIAKSDIYIKLIQAGKKYDLLPADMSRISSWKQNNNLPMLVDAGLNKEIYDEFY